MGRIGYGPLRSQRKLYIKIITKNFDILFAVLNCLVLYHEKPRYYLFYFMFY